MIICAATTLSVTFADVPSTAFDVMVGTTHGADMGAM